MDAVGQGTLFPYFQEKARAHSFPQDGIQNAQIETVRVASRQSRHAEAEMGLFNVSVVYVQACLSLIIPG